jgi:hypothetical protein
MFYVREQGLTTKGIERSVVRGKEPTMSEPNIEPVVVFRYQDVEHVYTVDGIRRRSITELLKLAGLVDDRWFTDASRIRGTAVHDLTSHFDLGALDVASCVSEYKGWLLAYVDAMQKFRPEWDEVEVPRVHPTRRFAGRPDRVGSVFNLRTIMEIKTGVVEYSHQVQTAMQAILVSASDPLPADHWQRLTIYLRGDGKWKLQPHRDRKDFQVAERILKEFAK